MNIITPRGRFAPSPTGPLHFGSLLAALGSYLNTKQQGGTWLIRVEDLDPPREQKGVTKQILSALAAHGLFPDETIVYQGQRGDLYQQALTTLRDKGLIYACACSRKDIAKTDKNNQYLNRYPGTCREKELVSGDNSTRVRTDQSVIHFNDLLQGKFEQNIEHEIGDFVLKRRDGLYAYQLAVVVDDAAQNITEVVRGCDLLDNTARQIYLQRLLQLPTPNYMHLPIAVNSQGQKLSKQTRAEALVNTEASRNLIQALNFLGQNPPKTLSGDRVDNILQWAIAHWRPSDIPKQQKIPV